jgi:hypothetical protein
MFSVGAERFIISPVRLKVEVVLVRPRIPYALISANQVSMHYEVEETAGKNPHIVSRARSRDTCYPGNSSTVEQDRLG